MDHTELAAAGLEDRSTKPAQPTPKASHDQEVSSRRGWRHKALTLATWPWEEDQSRRARWTSRGLPSLAASWFFAAPPSVTVGPSCRSAIACRAHQATVMSNTWVKKDPPAGSARQLDAPQRRPSLQPRQTPRNKSTSGRNRGARTDCFQARGGPRAGGESGTHPNKPPQLSPTALRREAVTAAVPSGGANPGPATAAGQGQTLPLSLSRHGAANHWATVGRPGESGLPPKRGRFPVMGPLSSEIVGHPRVRKTRRGVPPGRRRDEMT